MKKLLVMLLTITIFLFFAACERHNLSRSKKPVETEAPEFSRGVVEGQKYESEFIGIRYEAPEGWYFLTDKQIKRYVSSKTDNLIYDMAVANSDQSNMVYVFLQEMEEHTLKAVNFVQIFEQLAPKVTSVLQEKKYVDIQCYVDKITVDGKRLTCLKASALREDVPMYQMSFARKCNGYLAYVTVVAINEDNLESLLETFSWLE